MSRNHQIAIKKVSASIMFWAVMVFAVNAAGHEEKTVPQKLSVGTMIAPPLAMKTVDGHWKGLAIELWQAIGQDLGIEYKFLEYKDIGRILQEIEKGKLDVLIALTVTEPHETLLDFTHPFLTSGSAIAVPAAAAGHGLFYFTDHFVDRFVSTDFLILIGMLVLLSLAAGTLVWLFESRNKSNMFSVKAEKGLWQGLWWAMVTLTTVGYGDKTPRTPGGRIVALIWMFASIFLLASFTASITASLTLGELSGKVRGQSDLYNVRVGSISHSGASDYLNQRGIAAQPFKNDIDGLRAIVDGKIDAFVNDELILKYLVKTDFSGRIHVLPEIFNHYYVSIALPQGSALREPLNRALLDHIGTDEFLQFKERHIGFGR